MKKKKENQSNTLNNMKFATDWDVEKYKTVHDLEHLWMLKKKFIMKHKQKYPENRLVSLAQIFINVYSFGCRYDDSIMKLIKELMEGVAELNPKFKEQTFVLASCALEETVRVKREFQKSINATEPIDKSINSQNTAKPATYRDVPKGFVKAMNSSTTKEFENKKNVSMEIDNKPINIVCATEPSNSNDETMEVDKLITPSDKVKLENFNNTVNIEKPTNSSNKMELAHYIGATKEIEQTIQDVIGSGSFGEIVLFIDSGKMDLFNITHTAARLKKKLRFIMNNDDVSCTKCTLQFDELVLANGVGLTKAEAKMDACKVAVEKLRETSFTVLIKTPFHPGTIFSKDDFLKLKCNSSGVDVPMGDNKGNKMLKLMSSSGKDPEKVEKDVSQPIKAEDNLTGQGLGIKVNDTHLTKILSDYLNSVSLDDLFFSESFSRDDWRMIRKTAMQTFNKQLACEVYNGPFVRQLIISKKLTPFVMVKHLLNCGGESQKYKLFLPKDNGKLPNLKIAANNINQTIHNVTESGRFGKIVLFIESGDLYVNYITLTASKSNKTLSFKMNKDKCESVLCTLLFDDLEVATGVGSTEKEAKKEACKEGIEKLKKNCFTILIKLPFYAATVLSFNDSLQSRVGSTIPKNHLKDILHEFVKCDSIIDDLVFTDSLSKNDRAFIHRIVESEFYKKSLKSHSSTVVRVVHFVISKIHSPFAIVKQLLNCGGETEKFKLFLPKGKTPNSGKVKNIVSTTIEGPFGNVLLFQKLENGTAFNMKNSLTGSHLNTTFDLAQNENEEWKCRMKLNDVLLSAGTGYQQIDAINAANVAAMEKLRTFYFTVLVKPNSLVNKDVDRQCLIDVDNALCENKLADLFEEFISSGSLEDLIFSTEFTKQDMECVKINVESKFSEHLKTEIYDNLMVISRKLASEEIINQLQKCGNETAKYKLLSPDFDKIIHYVLDNGPFGKIVIYQEYKDTPDVTIEKTASAAKMKLSMPSTKLQNHYSVGVHLDNKLVSTGTGSTEINAKLEACKLALEALKETSFTVLTKIQINIDTVISKNSLPNCEIEVEDVPLDDSNKGSKMLKLMGWSGGGLGKNQQGISEPIKSANSRKRRYGLGVKVPETRDTFVDEQIRKVLIDFLENDLTSDLLFSDSFSCVDQKRICKTIDNAEFIERVQVIDRSATKLVVSKKFSSFEIIKKLLNCGGETVKYKLFLPKGWKEQTLKFWSK